MKGNSHLPFTISILFSGLDSGSHLILQSQTIGFSEKKINTSLLKMKKKESIVRIEENKKLKTIPLKFGVGGKWDKSTV